MAEQITFAEFIGQHSIKSQLEVLIKAAKMRGSSLDHILLCGSDQMGKLTLAKTIAPEMGANVRMIDSTVERPGDLAAIVTRLREKDILVIEDVELLHRPVIAVLTEAAGNFSMEIIVGKKAAAKQVHLKLPHFTIIATSTRPSQIERQLSQVLSTRYDFAPYSISEVSELVIMFAAQLNQIFEHDAAEFIARYCEGMPGKAKVLVKRIADFCLVKAPSSSINITLAKAALIHLGYARGTATPSELARKLNNMDGIEFEKFTAELLRKRGFTVEMTKATGDHGIDLLARKGQETFGIQCKRWTNPVGEPVIRDFYGSLLNSGLRAGYVIATSGFTPKAIDFAQGKPISLIDLDKLIELFLATH